MLFSGVDITRERQGKPWTRWPLDADTLPEAIEAARATTRAANPLPGEYEFAVETVDGELHRETVVVAMKEDA